MKTDRGNFFEDFSLGQKIVHATPRTVSEGDVALYTGLTGSRFAVNSADVFAMDQNYEVAPLDDILVFNMIFGRTVPGISLNAVANLGYAEGLFGVPVIPSDTLTATSEIIGIKENSSAKTGVVYVRTIGVNQVDEQVLEYVRWVMVAKRDVNTPAPETHVPDLAETVPAERLSVAEGTSFEDYDPAMAGGPHLWEDYRVGEKIDHVDGMTIEEAEHQLATRLYQNNARVHFNRFAEKNGRFGRRIVYGGHVISIARSLSFNGLANAFKVAAINSGRHVAPVFAGDTIFAWSEVLDKAEMARRGDVAALRLRTIACKDTDPGAFPGRGGDGAYAPEVVLDLDYWVLMPRGA
jgi:2-methylfumaryl-CoA hydratase